MNPDLFGYLGAALGAVMGVPQMWRLLRRRDPAGVSPATWAVLSASAICWVIYGFTYPATPQIPGNSVIAVLAAGVVVTLARLGVNVGPAVSLAAALVAATITALVVAGPVAAGSVAAVASVWLRVPQVVAAWRAPSVVGISATAWMLSLAAAGSWHIYSWLTGEWAVGAASGLSIAMSVAVVVLTRLRASRHHANVP